ncbi:MAG: hypothetical protein HY800_02595, partial [Ignavibacteriales bacterium]|nr:hypothetical protein [Ignavibacteriales bacterium]
VFTGSSTITPTAAITFGNVQISPGVTVTVTGNIMVAGNWTNNEGTYTPGTGTVTFNSTIAAQAINGTAIIQNFNNLTVNKSGQTLSVGGSTTSLVIDGNLALITGTFADGGAQITGSATGTMTMAAGTFLTLGTASTATSFPTYFTTGNISLNATSTVTYNSNQPQTISGVPTYGNVAVSATVPVTKTLGGALTVIGNLTINANTTLDISASNFPITIAGNWSRPREHY